MPTLASANRVQLTYMPETVFGVIPATGTPKNLRMTGESLNFDLTKENDKEIEASGQQTSVSTVGAQANGDVKIHMQYAEYDPFFASVMRGAWTVFGTGGVGSVFIMTSTATTITASVATTGLNLFTLLQKGQWFKLNAPGDPNNGKLLRVSTVTAPTATVITLDVATPAVVATSVAGCSIATSRLANDVTLTPFTIERQISEVTQYMAYRGMYPSKFSTSFASGSLTEGTFTFLGKDMKRGTVTQLPGAGAESKTFDVQNAVTGVGNIWEGGAPLVGTSIKSLSLDIDSGLRAQDAIGTLGLVGVGIGTFVAKGSLEVYFADGTLFDKFMNDTFTSISLSTADKDGNGYVFQFPRVQLTAAKVMAGGRDTDLMASFEYTAYADKANTVPALRKTLLIDRVGAAVV